MKIASVRPLALACLLIIPALTQGMSLAQEPQKLAASPFFLTANVKQHPIISAVIASSSLIVSAYYFRKNLAKLFSSFFAKSPRQSSVKNTPTVSSSPIIKHISWGKIQLEHNGTLTTQLTTYTYDCKIWPGGSKKWDWKETGTHHDPGIQIADVQDLVDTADIFVLSRGMQEMLKVKQETIDFLKSKNKIVHVEQTEKAVEMYNKHVKEGKKVAALIHSTC